MVRWGTEQWPKILTSAAVSAPPRFLPSSRYVGDGGPRRLEEPAVPADGVGDLVRLVHIDNLTVCARGGEHPVKDQRRAEKVLGRLAINFGLAALRGEGLFHPCCRGAISAVFVTLAVWLSYWKSWRKDTVNKPSHRSALWNVGPTIALAPRLALPTHQWAASARIVVAIWACSHVLDEELAPSHCSKHYGRSSLRLRKMPGLWIAPAVLIYFIASRWPRVVSNREGSPRTNATPA